MNARDASARDARDAHCEHGLLMRHIEDVRREHPTWTRKASAALVRRRMQASRKKTEAGVRS